MTVKAVKSLKGRRAVLLKGSCDSPERHCCVDVLCRGFDAVLILHQVLHFLHRFLHHHVPAAHPVQVPVQGLIQKPDGHHVVLHVPCQMVAGVL